MTPQGYALRTDRLEATLDGSRAVSPTRVRIEGQGLTIEAGAMRATTPPEGPPAGHVLFNGGVRLVYDPAEAAPSDDPE
jgi:lipopolysaccharide export system protein LptC